MQYQADYRGMGKFLRGPDARRVCTAAAAAGLTRSRGIVGRDSGETAASGRLVHGIGGRRRDRVLVSIVFGGVAVPLQFGNAHRRGTRFLTRGFEGA
jgi:hypothetical protein